jgi:hypothetical protein
VLVPAAITAALTAFFRKKFQLLPPQGEELPQKVCMPFAVQLQQLTFLVGLRFKRVYL